MPPKDQNSFYIECLRQDIEQRVGRPINTPSDFNFLYLEIQKKFNQSPSISTLKRMWAYVTNTSSRSMSTLNILSRYCGYRDWNHYVESLMRESRVESGFLSVNTLLSSSLHEGDRIVCTWNPGRRLEAVYMGNNQYVVSHVENSKLPENATFTNLIFTKGLPLVATDVRIDGQPMGNYVAGEKNGITSINFIPVSRPAGED
ncbi:MAG: hypothetical protein NC338_00900 [Firmicutes bacterium]|nr:hypothetical protein [Bacillota bacterium]MCM1402133.1 hypothetical protein [Bacteroides sp.]MCM1477172.1 hypothetical protein [Bacteroides sp.]